MRLRAPAKINLGLWVGARTHTGYHPIRTIFHQVAWCDWIRVAPAPALGLATDDKGLADLDRNLAVRAYRWAQAHWGPLPPVTIELTKRIPMGAGLGGGSSDAAQVLRWAWRQIYGELSVPGLRRWFGAIARDLGMDVPFFLLGGAAWAHGYGEQLEPLATVWAGRPLVLAYPGFSLSTAAVYAAYDQLAPTMRPDATRWALLRQGLLSGSVDPKWLDNSLEDAAWRVSPALRSFAEHVRQLAKPYPCFLSGSGSAYYIIGFDEDDHWALWLAERLKRHGVAWAQATQFLGPNGSGGKDDRDCMPLF